MSTRRQEILRQPVAQPKPECFAFRYVLDEFELRMGRDTPEWRESIVRRVKQRAAHELAQHILEHCQFINSAAIDTMMRGLPLHLELTVNDRGAYENWLPYERSQGKREGVKAAREQLPYGVDGELAGEFYE